MMQRHSFAALACLLAWLSAGWAVVSADEAPREALDFFERKIRPMLAQNCYECHGPEKQKGHLRLDSREAILAGGETGPAVVPGNPEESRLIKGISYTDPDFQMPPKKRLSERQVADFKEWVKLGAPWPPGLPGDGDATPKPRPRATEITDKDRTWWAFQPVKQPVLSDGRNSKISGKGPIDALVLAELAAKNLEPNPPATRRELIRRAYFDLIGLPPTYEQVRAFEHDDSPGAYEKLIDHLLALPQYGERWGRHWLDVVRFAQTTGYERDAEKPLAWRYRDYVIKAFNEDKPYDRFIKEQLAGDELPEVTDDSIIATGFFRLGVHDDEPADKQMAIFDEYDDYISTTGAAFLGLTLGCARCHDHKFDPISQADYYSTLAIFRSVKGYDGGKLDLDAGGFAPLAKPERVSAWQKQLEAKLKPVEDKLAVAKVATENARQSLKQQQEALKKLREELKAASDEAGKAALTGKIEKHQSEAREFESAVKQRAEEQKKLQEEFDKVKGEKPPWDWALAVREKEGKPDPTHILVRGNPLTPAAEVQPAFLSVLGAHRPRLDERGNGRRRALADWIASPDNPLTARVLVNRVWKHHFGKGLAKTTTDFGRAGVLPTHPQLLDWLAGEFMANGWSIKKLHKTIMLSEAYRRSSRADNPAANTTDPANDFLWRQNLRRLEAEAIRDTVLSVSGKLNLKPGGRGFFPRLAGEVIAGASRPGLDWDLVSDEEESRRSVYTFIKRTMLAPSLQSFDYSTTDSPLGERPVTTVAPQSLMLLNDAFMQKQAAAFASRLVRDVDDGLAFQVRRAYQLGLARDPTDRESELAIHLIEKQERAFDQLAQRVTFRPDVPESIYNAYQGKLRAEDHLIGPREGWSYHRGDWSRDYEGIRTVERVRGPFALWAGAEFSDGVIEAKLLPHRAVEFASLLFRASATNDVQRGYELALDAREQKVILRRHSTNVVTLAEAPAPIRAETVHAVRIEARGGEFTVWFDEASKPLLTARDAAPLAQTGRVGVRTWGAAASLDRLTFVDGTRIFDALVRPANALVHSPRQRALESFCLTLLNLNELVYVD